MLTGIVKHFDGRDGKLFGFIIQEVNGEVFFHYSFGGMMGCLGGDTPVFIPGVVERNPKSGDVLLFETVPGPKGPRASKWCFASTLITATQQIEARPLYRLVERRGFVNPSQLFRTGQAKYYVIWEGKNLDDLRVSFPKDRYPLTDEFTFARYFKIIQQDKVIVTEDGIQYPPEAVLDYNDDPR